MKVAEAADDTTFLAKVGTAPIRVVRYATVDPVMRGRRVLMQSVVALQYSAKRGDTEWIFKEIVPADERGRVNLSETLLERLREDHPEQIEMVHRSGSF